MKQHQQIIYQGISSIGLENVVIYLRDGLFLSDVKIKKIHPTKRKHRVAYMNEIYFHSYGCGPPQKLSKFIIKRNGHCLYSEYKMEGLTCQRDSYCAS